MHITVKAKFQDGVLVPLEPLNLNEGDEVFVSLDPKPNWQRAIPTEKAVKALQETAGAWAGIDRKEMLHLIYTARHRGLDCDCIYCAPAPEELPG